MNLFLVRFTATTGDMVFTDQVVVPAKTPAQAKDIFKDLWERSAGILSTPNDHQDVLPARLLLPRSSTTLAVLDAKPVHMKPDVKALKKPRK
jgi:hypothetical protein